MARGSVVAKVTRVAVFRGKGDIHYIVFDAKGPNHQFATAVLLDAIRELSGGDESMRVVVELENGLELGFTRIGEEVKVEIWPMLEHGSLLRVLS